METVSTSAEDRLASLGIHLPDAPTPFGPYAPAVQTGNLLFLSGMLATSGRSVTVAGTLGKDLDVTVGRKAAVTATINALALAKRQLGSLDRVSRIVRLGVHVAATPQFTEHPKVADTASDNEVPAENALKVAHLMAIQRLEKKRADGAEAPKLP